MSSAGLPRLDIDVRERRGERWAALIGSALVLFLPWLLLPWLAVSAPGTAHLMIPALLGVVLAAVSIAAFYRAGWLAGARRVERVIWDREGNWMLQDAAGRMRETHLRADTRIGPGCLWLRWQLTSPHTMLLIAGDIPADQLRRLSVRLRIDRHHDVAIPRTAAI
jgi:hypothetical protein